MNNKKTQINIVYSPSNGHQHKVFENEHGEIWHSKEKDPNKINVGMGWYSIPKPQPEDNILVVEPFCVLPRDYDVKFIKQFKYIFTWATEAITSDTIKNKVIPINHPTYHCVPNLKQKSEKWIPWDKKDNEIVIIANNKSSQHHSELYSLRIYLADVLDAFSPFKVSWYGQIPIKRPYYKGKADNKEKILNKAKFSICTENSYSKKFTHNYFTEKMPDVWASGAVPIYMGCYNINDMGNLDDCYIDLRPIVNKQGKSWKINKQHLNNIIKSFNEEKYKQYIDNLHNKIENTNFLHKFHSYKNVYEKIINTFKNENSSGK